MDPMQIWKRFSWGCFMLTRLKTETQATAKKMLSLVLLAWSIGKQQNRHTFYWSQDLDDQIKPLAHLSNGQAKKQTKKNILSCQINPSTSFTIITTKHFPMSNIQNRRHWWNFGCGLIRNERTHNQCNLVGN